MSGLFYCVFAVLSSSLSLSCFVHLSFSLSLCEHMLHVDISYSIKYTVHLLSLLQYAVSVALRQSTSYRLVHIYFEHQHSQDRKHLQYTIECLENLICFKGLARPHRCFQLPWLIRPLASCCSLVDLFCESLYVIKLYEPVRMISA